MYVPVCMHALTLKEAFVGWQALLLAPGPQLGDGVPGGDVGRHAEAVALLGLQVSHHSHVAVTLHLLLHTGGGGDNSSNAVL